MMRASYMKILTIWVLAAVMMVAQAGSAVAANCPTTTLPGPSQNTGKFEIGKCASNHTGKVYQSYEFITKVVDCMEGTVINATMQTMTIISIEFGWLFGALGTLVIIFFGVRLATGEREMLKRFSTLAVKMAFVVVFMNSLPFIVESVFDILNDLMRIVSRGYSPWTQIDIFLGNLVGYGPSTAMLNGLLGVIGSSLFSSKVGIILFLAGVLALINLLIFIMELVYTYALALITIGFMLTLLPVMLPLSLFFYTERYFKKWVDIIVSAMMTPILIFAFLSMFLDIFGILIQNIFDIFGGNDFHSYWRTNTSLFSWVMPSDPNQNMMMQNLSTSDDLDCIDRTIHPPVQTNINPMTKNSFNAGVGRVASLNFGANEVNMMQRITFAFVSLWLFATLMKSMLSQLPKVASSIASVASNIAFGGDSALIGKIKGQAGKLEGKVKEMSSGAGNISNMTSQISSMVGKRK